MQLPEPQHCLLSTLTKQELTNTSVKDFNLHHETKCNTEWAVPILHIWDVPGSNLSLQTSYSH